MSQWETRAIQKQLRGEVAQELHGPALLRRLCRKWANLPEVQRTPATARSKLQDEFGF